MLNLLVGAAFSILLGIIMGLLSGKDRNDL